MILCPTVYHYASVTPGPRLGRPLGFFTGIINLFAWLFGLTSAGIINSTILVEIYAIFHPSFSIQPWHIFLTFLILNTMACCFVIYFNRFLPATQLFSGTLLITVGITTVIVVTAMASEHASDAFVWTRWSNTTGW
jgi:choline transport protein